MVQRKKTRDSKGGWEEALRSLLQLQAIFLKQVGEHDRELVQIRREAAQYEREAAERFANIESLLLKHERMLKELPDLILEQLPEVIWKKIGFKPDTA